MTMFPSSTFGFNHHVQFNEDPIISSTNDLQNNDYKNGHSTSIMVMDDEQKDFHRMFLF